MLSDSLSEISGGVAGPVDLTANPPRRATGNQTRLAAFLLGSTSAAAKVAGIERLATVDAIST
jgi:hypothetical protein